eukprot:TRINITY_DN3937_c0_g1_i5.p1 TRINITY_DN3937_c0_g1~~TRINITY_DN3937_c0_g1_i5.p1  ORF type:complete len:230 (+),score=57.44 TRINITY_DN3937_c0_g1_i5:166-855(+)
MNVRFTPCLIEKKGNEVRESMSKRGLPTILKPIAASNIRPLESNRVRKEKYKVPVSVKGGKGALNKVIKDVKASSLKVEESKSRPSKEKLTKTQPNLLKKTSLSKTSNLKLPDESNYEKIVDFVKDLKVNIAHSSKQMKEVLLATCRPSKTKIITDFPYERANSDTLKRLINCWVAEDDFTDFKALRKKLHIGDNEEVALFSSLKVQGVDRELKFGVEDVRCIVDSIIQ